ncbi:MAG: DEAD/DEAH box helicase, partial [Candidatus Omnitrophica bacterium]|nr:DEAD/DEAH box helicase [Candidatus Omnitrophota bacterium]
MTVVCDQEKSSPLERDLRYVKGVGPQRSELLNRLGILTVDDLLHTYPRRYEDRRFPVTVSAAQSGAKHLLIGTIRSSRVTRRRGARSFLRVDFLASSGAFSAVWFASDYLEKTFVPGIRVALFGRVEKRGSLLQMIHPDYELLLDEDRRRIHTGRMVPFYSLTQDLSQRSMRNVQYQLLTQVLDEVRDPLPPAIRAARRLENRKFALKEIHFPSSPESLAGATRRLVFDEFFFIQMLLAQKKASAGRRRRIGAPGSFAPLWTEFRQLLPFVPTDDQDTAAAEIARDLESGRPMRRLLQGDVGSGKTTVAAFLIYAAIRSGAQAAMMVPTEILAHQHYLTLSRLFSSAGVEVGLLSQGQTEKSRQAVIRDLAEG